MICDLPGDCFLYGSLLCSEASCEGQTDEHER